MLAQVNQFGVAPEQVGIWLGCALGIVAGVVLVLSGINQWRRLMRPKRKRSEGFITRGEHEKSEARIFLRLDQHEADSRKWREEVGRELSAMNVQLMRIATKVGADHDS